MENERSKQAEFFLQAISGAFTNAGTHVSDRYRMTFRGDKGTNGSVRGLFRIIPMVQLKENPPPLVAYGSVSVTQERDRLRLHCRFFCPREDVSPEEMLNAASVAKLLGETSMRIRSHLELAGITVVS